MNRNYLLWQLLDCKYLDIDFLEWLIEKFDIELDIDSIKKEFWEAKLNILIYKVFLWIKDKFVDDNSEKIEKIIWSPIDDFQDYVIYTNFVDSHLYFNNIEIDELFQIWKWTILEKLDIK